MGERNERFCQHLSSQHAHAHVAARPGCGVGKGRSPFPTPHPLPPFPPDPSPPHPYPAGLWMSNPTRPPTRAKKQVRRLAHGHDAAAAARVYGTIRTHHPAGPPPQGPTDRPDISAMPPYSKASLFKPRTSHYYACMACMHGTHTASRMILFRGTSSPGNVRQHVTADSQSRS